MKFYNMLIRCPFGSPQRVTNGSFLSLLEILNPIHLILIEGTLGYAPLSKYCCFSIHLKGISSKARLVKSLQSNQWRPWGLNLLKEISMQYWEGWSFLKRNRWKVNPPKKEMNGGLILSWEKIILPRFLVLCLQGDIYILLIEYFSIELSPPLLLEFQRIIQGGWRRLRDIFYGEE